MEVSDLWMNCQSVAVIPDGELGMVTVDLKEPRRLSIRALHGAGSAADDSCNVPA